MKRIALLTIVLLVAAFAFANGEEEARDESGTPAGEMAGDMERLPEGMITEFDQTVEVAGVTVSWAVMGEMIRFQMSAETRGWVSIGFDPSRQMAEADMIIGYVEDDQVFVRDDWGTGAVRHGADTENGGTDNIVDAVGFQNSGVTTIQFTIPLNSGDELDKVLGGSHKMIVAYGPDRADDFGTYHAGRGSIDIEI